jgi:hypothetical protein
MTWRNTLAYNTTELIKTAYSFMIQALIFVTLIYPANMVEGNLISCAR